MYNRVDSSMASKAQTGQHHSREAEDRRPAEANSDTQKPSRAVGEQRSRHDRALHTHDLPLPQIPSVSALTG